MGADSTRLLRGAVAGAVGAGVWAAQQPLDRKIFGVDHDDVDMLGSLVTGERGTAAGLALGTALHLANGALFGGVYAVLAPTLPGPGVARGVAAGLAEHLATWPLTRLLPLHPAGGDFPKLWGDHRAFGQGLWRHAVFGAVLGALERRLNPPVGEPAPTEQDHSTSNGHGKLEHLAAARTV